MRYHQTQHLVMDSVPSEGLMSIKNGKSTSRKDMKSSDGIVSAFKSEFGYE